MDLQIISNTLCQVDYGPWVNECHMCVDTYYGQKVGPRLLSRCVVNKPDPEVTFLVRQTLTLPVKGLNFQYNKTGFTYSRV